ncbi:uncharacterized protein LOC129599081 [Paramacrobiotus metropolitanus]|uniref:uncharacterized protein LOC129599081 n=1 Tax=Paramacrobiotus metropolitanus TaxID=2943436 RepID=UPI002445F666|nr:uncharacterized protein LOC129599081 [Paramacrobiotus metropolitanus]
MDEFAAAVYRKGCPLDDVWGFKDGTFRPTCRPGEDQRTVYSGHYRLHGIKFQSIMAPNGIVVNLVGPWVGLRHDSGILADSGLLRALETKMEQMGKIFRLYGDPAYPISAYLEGPFKPATNQIEYDFNEAMSPCRIAVEWGFGEVVQQFAFLDFWKNLKIFLQPVGLLYTVGTLLLNCRVCLGYGGKVADYFCVVPATLEVRLNNNRE